MLDSEAEVRITMTITTIYHVTTDVPDVVADELDLAMPPYFGRICAAQKGSVSSGSDNFSDKTEWADFHTLSEAAAADKAMEALMKEFIPVAEAMRAEREESLEE